jgi:hypothetical protein
VIRPGSRYAIVKVTNGTMTTHVAETQDNIDVYTDGKGNSSLEVLPSLGVECLWVHGAGWTEDQIYESLNLVVGMVLQVRAGSSALPIETFAALSRAAFWDGWLRNAEALHPEVFALVRQEKDFLPLAVAE